MSVDKVEYFNSLGSKISDKVEILYVGKIKNTSQILKTGSKKKISFDLNPEKYGKHEKFSKEMQECRGNKELPGIYKNTNKTQETKLNNPKILQETFSSMGWDEAGETSYAMPSDDYNNPENLFTKSIEEEQVELRKNSWNMSKDDEDSETFSTGDKSSSESDELQLSFRPVVSELTSKFEQRKKKTYTFLIVFLNKIRFYLCIF